MPLPHLILLLLLLLLLLMMIVTMMIAEAMVGVDVGTKDRAPAHQGCGYCCCCLQYCQMGVALMCCLSCAAVQNMKLKRHGSLQHCLKKCD
jgi:hypothetical protein